VNGAERITIACLDLAGTTLVDGNAVETAFAEAIATVGVVPGTAAHARAMSRVREFRGRQKIEIFRTLFARDEALAQAANLSFERSYDLVVDRQGLNPVPGAESALERLRDAGVHVCLTTGFSRRTLGRILDTLDWWDRVDLALSPEDGDGAGRGRPYPDLILTAALRLGVDDVRHMAVCGDTENDILSGRRAGASILAGVLTGAHDKDQLRGAGATHVLGSVKEFPDLFLPLPPEPGSP
jgi:phosphonatase-like hydrolase